MNLSDSQIDKYKAVGAKAREILQNETERTQDKRDKLPVYQLHRRYIYLTGDKITISEFGRAFAYTSPDYAVQSSSYKARKNNCRCIMKVKWLREFDPDLNPTKELY